MSDIKKFDGDQARKSGGAKKWFQTKFIPGLAKAGNQRHLAAIRDSFGTLVPLIIAGSVGVLINAIIFGGAGSGYVSLLGLLAKASNSSMSWDAIGDLIAGTSGENGWYYTSKICGLAIGHMNTVTIGMMALYFSFLFGYFIATSRGNKTPIIAGLVSTAGLMLASLGEWQFAGVDGLVPAILIGIIVTELFCKFTNVKAFNIKLPDGVPPAVGKSFAVFLPVVFALGVISLVNITIMTPAMLTDMHVTKILSQLIDNSTDKNQLTAFLTNIKTIMGDETGAKFDALFAPATNNTPAGVLFEFTEHKEVVRQFFTEFSNLNVWIDGGSNSSVADDAFKSFWLSLDDTQKAISATSLLKLFDPNLSFASITEAAKLNFAFHNEGGLVSIVGRYKANTLGPTQFGISAGIYQFFTSWFLGFATSDAGLGLALASILFVSFFWFFGVHGTNLTAGIFEPIWYMILASNLTLVEAYNSVDIAAEFAGDQMGVFTKPFFDSFVWIGGSGAVLSLLINTLIFSKRKELKEIAKFGTPASVFQINEPVMFGFPLIMNPVYILPFALAPMANTIIGWLFISEGWVNYSYVQTPWTAPWFIGAVITTIDPLALVPVFIAFGIDILIYLPFVLLDNKLYFNRIKKENIELYEEEMKFFNDPEYKFNSITERNFTYKIERANNIISNAEARVSWLGGLKINPDKLKAIQEKNLEKANKKAEQKMVLIKEWKANRIAKAGELKPKWDEINAKKAEKLELKEKRKAEKLVSNQQKRV